MWSLLWLACQDPMAARIDAIPVPTLPAGVARGPMPVVAVDGADVLLDPTPWRDLVPDARPGVVLSLATPQEHAFALPALLTALEPLRDAAVAADRPPVFAVRADADVPYRAVVRVLYSLGMAQVDEVRLDVSTPDGPAALTLHFPRFCGAGAAAEGGDAQRLLELIGGREGPCVTPGITELPDGLRVVVHERTADQPGCALVSLGGDPGEAGGWRGATLVTAEGGCPSVAGRDPVALGALLRATEALGPACSDASLAPADGTPWGDVVALLAVVKERHPEAMLAAQPEGVGAECGRTWRLGG